MIPIPAYFVTVVAFLYAAEYIGRMVYLRPINYYWGAHALIGLYLGGIYLVYYLGGVPSELRHILGRYGVFGFVGVVVVDLILSHMKYTLGEERRRSWTSVMREKHDRTNH